MATTRKPMPNMPGLTPPGGGPGDTPYDQTDIGGAGGGAPLPTPQQGAQPAQPPVPAAPQGLVAQMGAPSTDAMSDQQLAGANPVDTTAQEMEQALQDPQTPPAVRQAIEQQLVLAAKQAMLGGQ